MNTPKTLEEHREYLYSIVRLKLFFTVRWQQEHPEESFRDILRRRVDIFRKTDLNPEGLNPAGDYFDLPGWRKVEDRLEEIFRLVRGDEKCFEEWGFDYLRPHIDNRCERDYLDQSRLAGYQCGFLRYNTGPYFSDKPDCLGFHIANDRSPDSFFDDPEYIKLCFNKLLDAAVKYGFANIRTRTWLNNIPRWLELFPPEWRESMEEPVTDVEWHYGFWGQFINARGTFNAKAGALLRQSGKLPCYPRSCQCSVTAMREFINRK